MEERYAKEKAEKQREYEEKQRKRDEQRKNGKSRQEKNLQPPLAIPWMISSIILLILEHVISPPAQNDIIQTGKFLKSHPVN